MQAEPAESAQQTLWYPRWWHVDVGMVVGAMSDVVFVQLPLLKFSGACARSPAATACLPVGLRSPNGPGLVTSRWGGRVLDHCSARSPAFRTTTIAVPFCKQLPLQRICHRLLRH